MHNTNSYSSYKVVDYSNPSSYATYSIYQPKRNTWKKTTCCGSFRYGSQCSDCPRK